MNNPAPRFDREVILKFFEICDWTCWALKTHSAIEQAPQINAVMKGKDRKFLWNLSAVTQEYALLQLSKLHDPAVQRRRHNLGLDYVIRFGNWSPETAAKLASLRLRLNEELADTIKPARNMTLCHNDLEILLKGIPLGEWVDPDTLGRYVGTLQEFVDIVFREALQDSALPLGDDAERAAQGFVKTLTMALEAP